MKFTFDDFFKRPRRTPVVSATPDADPKHIEQAKSLMESLKGIESPLADIVRKYRGMPGMQAFDLTLIIDGKPCTFKIQDGHMPQMMDFVEKGMIPANLPTAPHVPKEDLVASVETMLRSIYGNVKDEEVLGAIWSPHHAAAMKLAEILDKARDRDRKSIAKAIGKLLDGYGY